MERVPPALALLAGAIGISLVISHQSFYNHADARRWLPSAVGLLVIHLLATVTWAGVWALISRIIKHRAQFFAHVSVVSVGLILWYSLATVHTYGNFAFSNNPLISLLMQLLYFALGTTLVYLHLQYATLASKFRTLLLSSGFSFFVVGIVLLFGFSQQFDFSYDMPFPRDLKPPAFKVMPNRSVEQFLANTNSLEPEVRSMLNDPVTVE